MAEDWNDTFYDLFREAVGRYHEEMCIRDSIIGDRATGKTAIAMDTMIAQTDQNRLAEEGKLPDHQPLDVYKREVLFQHRRQIRQGPVGTGTGRQAPGVVRRLYACLLYTSRCV